MKKKIVFIIILFLGLSADACPICGCGVGNFMMGLLPGYNSKYIGLRYQYIQYHTEISSDASQFGNDYYNTVELYGGLNINKKWQLLALVPYHFNIQKSDDGIFRNNGAGDITMLANYNIFTSTKKNADKKILTNQQIWIGGGIKIPAGKYKIDLQNSESVLADANSQIGSGSVDFILNGTYNLSINKFGLNSSAIYKINTTNNQEYQFGNRLILNSIAFYRMQPQRVSYTPNAGLLYENFGSNNFQKSVVENTKGYALSALGGFEFGYQNFSLGANIQMPIRQQFASGQTQLKMRGLVNFSLSF